MAIKLKIFFWIGIFLILVGIVLLATTVMFLTFIEIMAVTRRGWIFFAAFSFGGLACLILGVVDLIVVGILLGKRQ